MCKMGLPGAGQSAGLWHEHWHDGRYVPAIGGKVRAIHRQAIGSTTVCRVDAAGNIKSLKRARVVTWPQLFLLGEHNSFTAQEIFATGMLMERMTTARERAWKSNLKKATEKVEKNPPVQGSRHCPPNIILPKSTAREAWQWKTEPETWRANYSEEQSAAAAESSQPMGQQSYQGDAPGPASGSQYSGWQPASASQYSGWQTWQSSGW